MSSQGAGASGYLRQARAEIFLVPGGGSAYPGKELPKRRQPGRWSRRTDAITQPWNGVLWPYLARQRQFHHSMACPQVWVGIRVIRKFRVGFFGFLKFRVLIIITRNLHRIIETRRFGYPKIRVRVQGIPELPDFFKLIASKLKAT